MGPVSIPPPMPITTPLGKVGILPLQSTPVKPVQFNVRPSTILPPGAHLPRRDWVTLNRMRSGVSRLNANLYRWGLSNSKDCICGFQEQTANHILFDCPELGPPRDVPIDLNHPKDETITWLQQLHDIT